MKFSDSLVYPSDPNRNGRRDAPAGRRGITGSGGPFQLSIVWLIVVILLPLLVLGSCKARPTSEECEQSLRHYIEMRFKNEPEKLAGALKRIEKLDKLVRMCSEKRKREEVLCEIKAKDLKEYRNCRRKIRRAAKPATDDR